MKRLPYILAVGYLVLVVIASIPVLTGKDALSGVFAVMLTLPWSWVLGNLIPSPSVAVGLAVILIGAFINASIIGAIARWLVNR